MKETVLSIEDIQCDATFLDDTVTDMMLNFLALEDHANAQVTCGAAPTTSYPDMFLECTGK